MMRDLENQGATVIAVSVLMRDEHYEAFVTVRDNRRPRLVIPVDAE